MHKVCSKCGDGFEKEKHGSICKPCTAASTRSCRRANGNKYTRKYERSPKGFVMRLYRNMRSRVMGIQQLKHHLYAGKELLTRDEFYEWSLYHHDFISLYSAWKCLGYPRKLTPSVDRIDSDRGYYVENMRWLTHSQNSRLGAISPKRGQKYRGAA